MLAASTLGRCFVLLALLVALAAVLLTAERARADEITSWPLGYYGQGEGRTWQTITVPGTVCGNGSEFRFRFSEGASEIGGEPNNRVVFWMPGGGSTSIRLNGELSTNITNLNRLSGLLNAGSGFTGRDRLMMDHMLNDEFIGPAHWVGLPYCTQDFHSGRRTEPVEYDFMSQTTLVSQINQAINNQGISPEELEEQFPGLRIEGQWDGGTFVIEGVFVTIHHRGALNIEAALPMVHTQLVNAGVDPDYAEVIIAGSSAGGFGVWYNAWRIGDFMYGRPGTKLTLMPLSGAPTSRSWDGEDIVEDVGQRLGLEHRLAWHDVLRPCDQPGAVYTEVTDDPCDDVLDLLDHYRARWDGMDVRFLPVVNKEDFVLVGGLGDQNAPDFPDRLLTLCQTIHRYSQYASITPDTFPYTTWQFERLFTGNNWNVKRVHGYTEATHLVPMFSPDGGAPSTDGLLAYMNGVASRRIQHGEAPVFIEHVANLVNNIHDPNTTVTPWEGADQGDYMPECNVAWPQSFRPPPKGSAVGGVAELPPIGSTSDGRLGAVPLALAAAALLVVLLAVGALRRSRAR